MLGLIFLNGLLSGLSGCIFLLFPVLLSRINSNESKAGILKFILGVAISQSILFLSFNLLNSTLVNLIKSFQAILLIASSLVLFYLFYKNVFDKSRGFSIQAKSKNSKSLYMGFLFGFSISSCNIGFIIGSVAISSTYNLIMAFLSSIVYSFAMVLPLLILAILVKDSHRFIAKYQKHENLFNKISNGLLLLLSYYLIYLGFSSFKSSNTLVSLNFFYLNLIITIILFAFYTYTFITKKEYPKRKIISILGIITLFFYHCFIRANSCLICTIDQTDCLIEFLIFLFFVFIGIKKSKFKR